MAISKAWPIWIKHLQRLVSNSGARAYSACLRGQLSSNVRPRISHGRGAEALNTNHSAIAYSAVLKFVESVVLFVHDIHAAAAWYANLLGSQVRYENPNYAYVQGPGVLIGFHPADAKCPGGVGGTTVYWEVDDLAAAVAHLSALGAHLLRGSGTTDFGAGAAMLVCPFGCTIGLNCSTPASRAALATNHSSSPAPGEA